MFKATPTNCYLIEVLESKKQSLIFMKRTYQHDEEAKQVSFPRVAYLEMMPLKLQNMNKSSDNVNAYQT
jgi:hypothetical protein